MRIKRGMLTATVDADKRGGVATCYSRLLKEYFCTAPVSTSVGGAVVEESADTAGLSHLLHREAE